MKKFIPTTCFECGHKLAVTQSKTGKYKLICPNEKCSGVAVRKFQKGMLAFEIAGIGPANYVKLFDAGIRDIYDLLTVTDSELINSGQFKSGRALEKMMVAISSLKFINLDKLILSLQFDKVGRSISKEIANYYNECDYNFDGFDYSVRDEITNPESKLNQKINEMVDKLSTIDQIILVTKEETTKKDENMETIVIELTGSPKSFGFNTKNDFLDVVKPFGVIHGRLNKDCHYLVTDDTSSVTNKMTKATKLGVGIVTYEELVNIVKK